MLHFHVMIEAAEPPWKVTFDEAFAALEQVPGLFLEPDGSFCRTSRPEEPKWQVEGNLYDQGPQLAYVEVKGSCPADILDEFLRPLGWPEVTLLFQMVQEGMKLDEAMFRQVANRNR